MRIDGNILTHTRCLDCGSLVFDGQPHTCHSHSFSTPSHLNWCNKCGKDLRYGHCGCLNYEVPTGGSKNVGKSKQERAKNDALDVVAHIISKVNADEIHEVRTEREIIQKNGKTEYGKLSYTIVIDDKGGE